MLVDNTGTYRFNVVRHCLCFKLEQSGVGDTHSVWAQRMENQL